MEIIQNGDFSQQFLYWTNGVGDKRPFRLDDEMAKAGGEDLVEGMISAWIGGYFTDGVNGGYTRVLGTDNTIAAVNTLLNSSGWYVCDGSALNLGTSTIFNGSGRYLPNLTDDRFIMGDTVAGGSGGSNTMAHTHGIGSYVAANENVHTHAKGSFAVGSHNHISPQGQTSGKVVYAGEHYGKTSAITVDPCHHTGTAAEVSQNLSLYYTSSTTPGFSGTSAAGSAHTHTLSGISALASNSENRPEYLSCFYIMYVLA